MTDKEIMDSFGQWVISVGRMDKVMDILFPFIEESFYQVLASAGDDKEHVHIRNEMLKNIMSLHDYIKDLHKETVH
mgnify:CR=1 FL=1